MCSGVLGTVGKLATKGLSAAPMLAASPALALMSHKKKKTATQAAGGALPTAVLGG